MTDEMIVAVIGLIGGLIVIIAPIIRLNSHITELTVLFRELKDLVKEKTDTLDTRITNHGNEIDQLRVNVTDHEARIRQLEK